MNDSVSIIIPVFNGEKTLHKCMDSVLAQTHGAFEVILLDDGSGDGTPDICDAYEKSDGRVKVIHKSNSGVSDTRNRGLEMASGVWTAFIDADDYVNPRFMEEAITLGNLHRLDIVIGGLELQYKDRSVPEVNSENHIFGEETGMSDHTSELIRAMLSNIPPPCGGVEAKLLGHPVSRLYRTSVIKNTGFPKEIKLREDMLFNLEAFHRADRIGTVKGTWYHYVIHHQSAFHAYHKNYTGEAKNFLSRCEEFVKAHHPDMMRELCICTLYTYMTWLKVFVLHKDSGHSIWRKRALIRESFGDALWQRAFAEFQGGRSSGQLSEGSTEHESGMPFNRGTATSSVHVSGKPYDLPKSSDLPKHYRLLVKAYEMKSPGSIIALAAGSGILKTLKSQGPGRYNKHNSEGVSYDRSFIRRGKSGRGDEPHV